MQSQHANNSLHSRDITRLYTVNCYIGKQILYCARQIDEQRKVSSANR